MMDPQVAKLHWRLGGPVRASVDAGLINGTWLVGEPAMGVLQWVNPIFAPEVNLDIQASVERLLSRGLATPRLLPTDDGRLYQLCVYADGGDALSLDVATAAAA